MRLQLFSQVVSGFLPERILCKLKMSGLILRKRHSNNFAGSELTKSLDIIINPSLFTVQSSQINTEYHEQKGVMKKINLAQVKKTKRQPNKNNEYKCVHGTIKAFAENILSEVYSKDNPANYRNIYCHINESDFDKVCLYAKTKSRYYRSLFELSKRWENSGNPFCVLYSKILKIQLEKAGLKKESDFQPVVVNFNLSKDCIICDELGRNPTVNILTLQQQENSNLSYQPIENNEEDIEWGKISDLKLLSATFEHNTENIDKLITIITMLLIYVVFNSLSKKKMKVMTIGKKSFKKP